MFCDWNFDHLKSFFHTCFLRSPSHFSLSLSPQLSLLQPLCLCKSQNHRIMSSSSSCGEPRSLLQPRASLIWILFKSAIPLIVGLPWKVTLSLKPINTGSFKITFALLKEDAERRFSCPWNRLSFQVRIWPQKNVRFCEIKDAKVTIRISHWFYSRN